MEKTTSLPSRFVDGKEARKEIDKYEKKLRDLKKHKKFAQIQSDELRNWASSVFENFYFTLGEVKEKYPKNRQHIPREALNELSSNIKGFIEEVERIITQEDKDRSFYPEQSFYNSNVISSEADTNKQKQTARGFVPTLFPTQAMLTDLQETISPPPPLTSRWSRRQPELQQYSVNNLPDLEKTTSLPSRFVDGKEARKEIDKYEKKLRDLKKHKKFAQIRSDELRNWASSVFENFYFTLGEVKGKYPKNRQHIPREALNELSSNIKGFIEEVERIITQEDKDRSFYPEQNFYNSNVISSEADTNKQKQTARGFVPTLFPTQADHGSSRSSSLHSSTGPSYEDAMLDVNYPVRSLPDFMRANSNPANN